MERTRLSSCLGTVVHQPIPTSGSIKVAGKDVPKSISFQLVTYELTFAESGLVPGTYWSVTIAGQPEKTANTPDIIFSEPNGTYSYTLGSVYGYTTTSSSGQQTVPGSAETVPIAWTQLLYSVEFLESGLPTSSLWFVNFTFNASTSLNQSSTSPEITFSAPDLGTSLSTSTARPAIIRFPSARSWRSTGKPPKGRSISPNPYSPSPS